MAIAFPAALASMFSRFPIQASSPELQESYEMNQSGFGEVLTAELGTRLWKMSVSIRPGHYREMERVRSRLNLLRQAGRTLFVHAVPGEFPAYDPTGSIMGAATPLLNSVAGNMRDITISGLPGGYRITDGDFLSFQYGSNPTRYAFHQVFIANTNGWIAANGAGLTGPIEVTPNIRPGFTLDVPIQLIRPYFKGMIVPDSTSLGTSAQQFTKDISFTLMQTLRN